MSVTWADALQSVRDRIGDDPASPATPYYTDAYVYRVILRRARVRAGEMARLAPNFYLSELSYASVADQADYTWPSNFGRFVRLERQYGTSPNWFFQEVPVKNAELQYDPGEQKLRPLLYLPDSVRAMRKTVSVWQLSFRLNPIPVDASETYVLKYLRKVVNYVLTTDVLDVPEEWADYLSADCAVVVGKRKGDARVPTWEAERKEEYESIRRHFRRLRMDVEGFGPMESM